MNSRITRTSKHNLEFQCPIHQNEIEGAYDIAEEN